MSTYRFVYIIIRRVISRSYNKYIEFNSDTVKILRTIYNADL